MLPSSSWSSSNILIFHFLPVEEEIIAQQLCSSVCVGHVDRLVAWPVLAAPHNFYFWFGLLCCSVRSEGQSADEGHLWAISIQQAQPSNQGNNGTPSVTELLPQSYSSLAFTTTLELVRPVSVHRWLWWRCVYHRYDIYIRTTLSHVSHTPHRYGLVPVYTLYRVSYPGGSELSLSSPGSHNTHQPAPVNVL